MIKNAESDFYDTLACPKTKKALRLCDLQEAEELTGIALSCRSTVLNAKGVSVKPFGKTEKVMLREDLRCAYPIVDGIPILLAPEMLFLPQVAGEAGSTLTQCVPHEAGSTLTQCVPHEANLTLAQYVGAYTEMAHYNECACLELKNVVEPCFCGLLKSGSTVVTAKTNLFSEFKSFPEPKNKWIDAVYDSHAQYDAYNYIKPIAGKRVMQLGGKGQYAIKFLQVGAVEAWLITPMLEEALYAMALARYTGMEDKLHCVVGIAEELPIKTESFDVVHACGCLHHMQTEPACSEVSRVLRAGGKFTAIEPWRAPLYSIGTAILGKRNPDVCCKPLTEARIEPIQKFFKQFEIIHHSVFVRYLLLAFSKFGLKSGFFLSWYLMWADDVFCSLIPRLRKFGSSVTILAVK